ncbi:MAG TPA: ABC transporter permease [Chitinophagaceae bacterium]|nr:ABC transporter permease [Chitinophagaceae bacterium]
METVIPKTSAALTSLLRADFITQWRNRRSVVLLLLVPVIILISWKGLIAKVGGAFVLSTCITIGLTAIGLMGYSNSIARDRDKGVFQRLRVTPVPTWSIMGSRLIVQLILILLVTTAVFIVGSEYDKVNLSPGGYALTYLAAFFGGALYLGLGQMIVGLVKNAETVNSTTRLVYFVFIMVGMFGDIGVFPEKLQKIIKWSPYGTVKTLLASSMQPSHWNNNSTMALFATIAYALLFSFLGIKNFKWNTN